MNYIQFCTSSLVSAKRLQLYNSPTTTTRKKNSFYFSLMLLSGDYLTNYYLLTDAKSIKQDSSFLQSHTIKIYNRDRSTSHEKYTDSPYSLTSVYPVESRFKIANSNLRCEWTGTGNFVSEILFKIWFTYRGSFPQHQTKCFFYWSWVIVSNFLLSTAPRTAPRLLHVSSL